MADSVADLLASVPAATQAPPVFTDRPPPSAPDTAPAATGLRVKTRQDINTTDLSPALVSRVNRLYDAIPEEIRQHAEIAQLAPQGEFGGIRTIAGSPPKLPPTSVSAAGLTTNDRPLTELNPDIPPPRHGLDTIGFANEGKNRLVVQWMNSPDGKKLASSLGLNVSDSGMVELSESARQADLVTTARRSDKAQVSDGQLNDLLNGLPAAGTPGSNVAPVDTTALILPGAIGGIALPNPFMGVLGAVLAPEEYSAITNGVRKGATNAVLGLAQATLPESVLQPVMDQYNKINSQYSELEDKHPNLDYVGRLTGETAAILSGSGALGALKLGAVMPRAVTAAVEAVGPIGRTAAVGVGVGATQYYPQGADKEERPLGAPPRAFDAAMGGVFGALGGSVAKGVQWAAKNLANTAYGGQFMQILQNTTAGLTKNTQAPLEDALSHYQQVEKAASTRYGLRNAAGSQFEGFPSGVGSELGEPTGLRQAIDGALDMSKKSGVETRRVVETTASRVKSLLGLDKEEGRLAEWKVQQQRAQEQTQKAQEAINTHPLKGAFASNPSLIQQLQASGGLPPMPAPLPPFQASAVSPEQYAQARTAINRAYRSSRDPAAKTQLGMMLREVDKVGTDTAQLYGMEAKQFLRRAEEANKFYEQNVAPLRQLFGGKMAREVAGRAGVPLDGVTPAAFYDKLAGLIRKNDSKAVEDVAKVLGPKGRDNTKMIAVNEALEAGGGKAGATLEYIQERSEMFRTLLGRDEYTQLVGMGKIAETLTTQFKANPRKILDWTTHGMGLGFAMYALLEGHYGRALAGLAAPPLYHAVLNTLQRIHGLNVYTPVVRRAASLRPGSPEMTELLSALERRVRAATVVPARAEAP